MRSTECKKWLQRRGYLQRTDKTPYKKFSRKVLRGGNMNRLAPSAGPLAFISPVIEFAEPGDKLKTFVDQVRVVGILLRKGRFNSDAEMVKRELWGIAQANGLTDEPDSFAEEMVEYEIDKATAIDD